MTFAMTAAAFGITAAYWFAAVRAQERWERLDRELGY